MLQLADGLYDYGYWHGPVTFTYDDEEKACNDWHSILNTLNLEQIAYTFEVRGTGFRPSKGRSNSITEWHKDCGGAGKYIIIWASFNATKLRNNSQNKIKLKARHIYVLSNTLYEHATPRNYNPKRLFARAYLPSTWSPANV